MILSVVPRLLLAVSLPAAIISAAPKPRLAEIDPGKETSSTQLAAAQAAGIRKDIPRQPHGNATVTVAGELHPWHKVTLNLAGPFAAETDTSPNPFTDYRCDVTFTHESGSPSYTVPGYFAADGDAANSSATAGTVWRAHLAPDKPGRWTYRVSFASGPGVAAGGGGKALVPFDGLSGEFSVTTTKVNSARDFRGLGRLTYTSNHYLHFAGSGQPFLKFGADSPETMLGYIDFDDTIALKKNVPLKTWQPHLGDWRERDPSWAGGKGKGLIGALNYLAAKGVNGISLLTYNAAGDGDNVWPFISRDEKFHYDCSKLDQWAIVLEHAGAQGLFLDIKLEEQENDDNRVGGPSLTPGRVAESLDGGDTGPERKLYLRELIARFGHLLALNWNLGEECTLSPTQINAMADYIAATDAYHHPIVVHTFIPAQDKIYTPLLGDKSKLTGASLQNEWDHTHQRTLKWVRESAAASRPWVAFNDEQGPAWAGVPPDRGYRGYDGITRDNRSVPYTQDDVRHQTLWGNLMAGGAGIDCYFGYQLAENDLVAEDFRSRDRWWDYGRHAVEFFADHKIPVEKMSNADELVGNAAHDNSRYCFALPGQLYLVYLPDGGQIALDLKAAPGAFSVSWFNPRDGGDLTSASAVSGGSAVSLNAPSSDDWLAVVRRP
ncbi:MAG: DUF5060 domain-containing protein [Opitutus sp.]